MEALTIQVFDRVEALGPEWDGVFANGAGVQTGRTWFEASAQAALPPGAAPRLLGVLDAAGAPIALLPMQQERGRLASLTTPFSVLFQPLLAPGADPFGVGRVLGRHLRAWPVVLLEALDPHWTGLEPWLAGLRRAGLAGSRFDQFGNWHESVAGLGWDAYLARRPGALRETLRRKGRLLQRDAGLRFETVSDPAALPAALDAFEAVYARSWKVAEPFPHFTAALLSRLAAAGQMRLGVMWQGNRPVAAQYWTVADGTATVLKLAHDDAAKALSPGTLLTAHMIRGLLEQGVTELDFGRGDDPYKRQWAAVRRQRIGVVLANPLRPGGLLALARQAAGKGLRILRNR